MKFSSPPACKEMSEEEQQKAREEALAHPEEENVHRPDNFSKAHAVWWAGVACRTLKDDFPNRAFFVIPLFVSYGKPSEQTVAVC